MITTGDVSSSLNRNISESGGEEGPKSVNGDIGGVDGGDAEGSTLSLLVV